MQVTCIHPRKHSRHRQTAFQRGFSFCPLRQVGIVRGWQAIIKTSALSSSARSVLPRGATPVHSTSTKPKGAALAGNAHARAQAHLELLRTTIFCFLIAPLLAEPCKKEMSGYQTSKFCQAGISSECLVDIPWYALPKSVRADPK